MNVSDLVAKLTKLQIEQDDIIQQLADRAKDTEAETEDKKPAAATRSRYRNPYREKRVTPNRWRLVQ
jgi:hypothetical protein